MTTRAGRQYPRLAIKMGRAMRRQTQADLAEALTEHTGTAWSAAMVRDLERGHTRFTVDALLDIADVQELPVEFYLRPPQKGAEVNAHNLRYVKLPHERTASADDPVRSPSKSPIMWDNR